MEDKKEGNEDASREGGESSDGPTSVIVDDKRGSVDESTIEGLENIRGSLHLSQSDVEEPSAPLTLSPREEFYMGWLLWRGIKVSQNKKAALKHFRIAAEGGHSGAMFTLGHAYYTGEAVTQDRAKGMKYFEMAASLNYLPAYHILGSVQFNSNEGEATAWLTMAVDEDKRLGISNILSQGDNISQNSFGLACYHLGKLHFRAAKSSDDEETATMNEKAGLEAMENAAYTGAVPDACYQLAKLYLPPLDDIEAAVLNHELWNAIKNETGNITYNWGEAKSLLESAAKGGHNRAQYALAMVLEVGGGYDGKAWVEDFEGVLSWYLAAAKGGHMRAQYRLGLCAEFGDLGWRKSNLEALKWFRKAASQGFPQAQYRVGKFLHEGLGVDQNFEVAAQCYEEAANGFHAGAFYRLGELHLSETPWEGRDPKLGMEWLEKAAESGEMKAALVLAKVLLSGEHSIPRNAEVALPWLVTILDSTESDAEVIHEAQALLGKCFMEGDGVAEPAPQEAEPFLKAAAEGGNVEGAFYYSQLLYTSKGTKRDKEVGLEWLAFAAEEGHGLACYHLAVFCEKKNRMDHAEQWYKACVDILREYVSNQTKTASSPLYYYILGMIHLAGKGVPKNRKLAINYLSQSAGLGNTHAMYSYAKALMSSKGDETTRAKNMEKALLWLSKASYLNHSEAQFELASLYSRGEGVRKNDQRATRLYERSSQSALDGRAKTDSIDRLISASRAESRAAFDEANTPFKDIITMKQPSLPKNRSPAASFQNGSTKTHRVIRPRTSMT